MTRFTTEYIVRLRELAAKVTPRPWKWLGVTKIDCDNGLRIYIDAASDYDTRYIVAAANAMPAALDEIERLTAENARLREALEWYADGYGVNGHNRGAIIARDALSGGAK